MAASGVLWCLDCRVVPGIVRCAGNRAGTRWSGNGSWHREQRHDWEAGDLLLLPVKKGGVEHQHFNKDDAHPAKWIAFISAALFEAGASEMVQLENHPDFQAKPQRNGRNGR